MVIVLSEKLSRGPGIRLLPELKGWWELQPSTDAINGSIAQLRLFQKTAKCFCVSTHAQPCLLQERHSAKGHTWKNLFSSSVFPLWLLAKHSLTPLFFWSKGRRPQAADVLARVQIKAILQELKKKPYQPSSNLPICWINKRNPQMKNHLYEPTQYFTVHAKANKPAVLEAQHLASHNTVQAQVRDDNKYLGVRLRWNWVFFSVLCLLFCAWE